MTVGAQTKLALDHYIASTFDTRQGHRTSLVGLDEAGIAEFVRALGMRSGFDRPLRVHQLRQAAILRAWAHREEGDK